jgi:hypothetical protein
MNKNMLLNKDQIAQVRVLASIKKSEHPTYREGQLFFNALNKLFPLVADTIRASEFDPFYNDDIIDKCIKEISVVGTPFERGIESDIKIKSVKYVEGYKLQIVFNDGHENIFDYKNIVTSGHEESKPYVDVENFKKFKITSKHTEIAWGENFDEMLVPLDTLYSKSRVNRISKKAQEAIKKFEKDYSTTNKKIKHNKDTWERAKLIMEMLLKQPPVSLEEARAQALWLTIGSSSRSAENKIDHIKYLLTMYYPDWTQKQIEFEQKNIFELSNAGNDAKDAITERLNKLKKEGH